MNLHIVRTPPHHKMISGHQVADKTSHVPWPCWGSGRSVGSSRGDSERPGVFVLTMKSNSSKTIVGEFSVAMQKTSVVEGWRTRFWHIFFLEGIQCPNWLMPHQIYPVQDRGLREDVKPASKTLMDLYTKSANQKLPVSYGNLAPSKSWHPINCPKYACETMVSVWKGL